jgi:hypothetical protein
MTLHEFDEKLNDAYKLLAAASDIRIGTRVTVVRAAETRELGWDNSWVSGMSAFVGKTGTVMVPDSGSGYRIKFKDDVTYQFPFFTLQIAPMPTVQVELLSYGSTATVSFDKGEIRVSGFPTTASLNADDLKRLLAGIRQLRKIADAS